MPDDQAAGLRRLFSQRAARVLLVADASWPQRGWFTLNLAAALSRAGEQVVLLDAEKDGVAALWGARCRYELIHVLQGDRRLCDAIVPGPESSAILPMRRAAAALAQHGHEGRGMLSRALDSFMEPDGVLVVPVSPSSLESPLWRIGAGEVLVCAGEGSASTKQAYAAIKALHGQRPQPAVRLALAFGRDCDAALDRFNHMQEVTQRFLGTPLAYAGALPAEALRRGAPGRSLFDDAPRAFEFIEAIARDAGQWRLPRLELCGRIVAKHHGASATF